MLHSSTGTGIDAAPLARDAPLHQLSARLELRFEASNRRTRLRVDAQDPPWKVIRAFQQANGGALVHLHNVSGGILAGDRLSLRIDVGARAEVFRTVRRLARDGLGVMFASSDLKEVMAMADRIVVMAGGRVTGDFPRAKATEERLVAAANRAVAGGMAR